MANANITTKPKKERKVKGKVVIDIEKCKGCELCRVVCKEDALVLSKEINHKGYRYIVAINDNCTGCVNCALVCPDAVIKVYRTNPKKKKELIAEIKNVQSSMDLKIDNPVVEDLQRMEYL
ncbi:MAG: 4Fe-4S dicluster domain-containing protein [Ignavibacteriae bacterium]|nr:MAG: 4Fe-4S dicluster domain-containing protein [Ignavibacteriota bacterium]